MRRWKVPNIWREAWIIGGGPSMPKQFGVPEEVINGVRNGKLQPSAYSPYLESIHSKHVVGINAAYLIGDWMDAVFFGDRGWWLVNRMKLAKFRGLKVSCNSLTDGSVEENVRYLARTQRPRGISEDPSLVTWNKNSGAAAISMLVNMGCKRIILLGFDMDLDKNNKSHWHGLYKWSKKREESKKTDMKSLPFHRHLLGFDQIARDAKRRGVTILNASPESKIECFRKVTVKELLNEEQTAQEV